MLQACYYLVTSAKISSTSIIYLRPVELRIDDVYISPFLCTRVTATKESSLVAYGIRNLFYNLNHCK